MAYSVVQSRISEDMTLPPSHLIMQVSHLCILSSHLNIGMVLLESYMTTAGHWSLIYYAIIQKSFDSLYMINAASNCISYVVLQCFYLVLHFPSTVYLVSVTRLYLYIYLVRLTFKASHIGIIPSKSHQNFNAGVTIIGIVLKTSIFPITCREGVTYIVFNFLRLSLKQVLTFVKRSHNPPLFVLTTLFPFLFEKVVGQKTESPRFGCSEANQKSCRVR